RAAAAACARPGRRAVHDRSAGRAPRAIRIRREPRAAGDRAIRRARIVLRGSTIARNPEVGWRLEEENLMAPQSSRRRFMAVAAGTAAWMRVARSVRAESVAAQATRAGQLKIGVASYS